MSTEVRGDLLLLGRGKLYFDRFTDLGVKTGERFLGNCTRLEATTTDDLREKYSSATEDSPLMKSVNVRRTMELALTLDEFDPENVALALMGEAGYLAAQTGAAVTAEAHADVIQGRWYKLAYRGKTGTPITALSVKGAGGTPTYTITTDYLVDLVGGRVYIVEGGTITSGSDIQVAYTYPTTTATDIPKVVAGTKNTVEGMLRFIGDPAAGPVYECEIWHVSLTPDGPIGLISDDFAEFPLKGKILSDAVAHPTEPLWRLLKLS